MSIVDNELRQLFNRAVRVAQHVNYTPALMGRDDGGGSFTFLAASGDGQVYVRILKGGVVTLARAINQAGIAHTGDLPIWLDKGPDGRWIIVSARYTG
jgi:hypothetical protein